MRTSLGRLMKLSSNVLVVVLCSIPMLELLHVLCEFICDRDVIECRQCLRGTACRHLNLNYCSESQK